jgi:hypothetical protein
MSTMQTLNPELLTSPILPFYVPHLTIHLCQRYLFFSSEILLKKSQSVIFGHHHDKWIIT